MSKSNKQTKSPAPFLKWAGGKRQLLPEIQKRMPKQYKNYFEPFLGGGAVFFDQCEGMSGAAVLSDLNTELINVYTMIRDRVDKVIEYLKDCENVKEYFLYVRQWDRLPNYDLMFPEKRAARFIFLNRTCFNGLYRVNKAGQFNTPYGDYQNPNIVRAEVLRAASVALQGVEIKNQDFSAILETALHGDFVYFDPPYDPLNPASFTAYTGAKFGKQEQKSLLLVCDILNKRGVKWMLSNSNTNFIKDLYKNYNISLVDAKRNINSKASKRGAIKEVLITNY